MHKVIYRLENRNPEKGLWYNRSGEYCDTMKNELLGINVCLLPMPFDQRAVGYLSGCESLEELRNWFPKEDDEKLSKAGFYICLYSVPASHVKILDNHLVFLESKDSVVIYQLGF